MKLKERDEVSGEAVPPQLTPKYSQ